MNNRPSQPFLTRAHIFAAAFFAVFIFLLYQMLRILAPFSSALLWAAVITIALHPLYKKLLLLMKGRANLSAGLMTLCTLALVISPAVFLFAALASQVVDIYRDASEIIRTGAWIETWNSLKSSFLGSILSLPYIAEMDIKGHVIKGLGELSSDMASQVGNMLKNMLLTALNLLIMLISLFFFFRDGESYFAKTMELLPFTAEQKRSISQKLGNTFSAVINGVFFIALLQGLMTGIGFAIFGVPFPIFWGFIAAIFALFPLGGAALVWVPGAVYLYLKGMTLSGVFLLTWGLFLVSLPDNFLKPILIGKKAKLPTFILFIGILGGLKVYGILGIIFGPIVVTLLTAFIQIYREEYGGREISNYK